MSTATGTLPSTRAPTTTAPSMSAARLAGRTRRISLRLWPRTGAAWTPALLAVAAVCIGLPVVAAALSGSLSIPHNDAWSMSRIAATFATTGQIHLLGWNDMNLIGQVVMLGPFGGSLVVQQLAVAGLSLVCLLCVYRLLAVSLTTRDAVLGVVLLGVWPGWASLSTSFETDVPTFAATFAALLLGRRALMRDSRGWLVASLLVSLWAVSIREQAIAAPVAILVAAWLTRRSRRRLQARWLFAAAVGLTLMLAVFEAWRWGLALGQDPGVTAGPLRFAGDLAACGSRLYLTVALCLSPAVLVAAGRHRWVCRDVRALGVGAALVALALLCGGVLGRYLEPSGEYAQVLPGARVVIPGPEWDALVALGCLSGVLLVPVARARWRSVDPLLGMFTILALAETVVLGAAGNGVCDRYLPALVPGTLTVLLAHPRSHGMPRRRRRHGTGVTVSLVSAIVALALVGVISGLLAANGFAFDTARWHAAQRIARTGIAPDRIDAGLEWTGWHSPHGMIRSRRQAARPGGWALAFSRSPACVVLSPSPLTPGATGEAGWTPDGSSAYRTYLVVGRSRLYRYATHARGCPS